jgi:topoisomerase IA-like protein
MSAVYSDPLATKRCLKMPQMMWVETWAEADKVKKNQSPRNLQSKGVVELLIDRAQSARRDKWEIKATKKGARKQKPRIKCPLGTP